MLSNRTKRREIVVNKGNIHNRHKKILISFLCVLKLPGEKLMSHSKTIHELLSMLALLNREVLEI
jgi:hypothetical protein